MKRGLILGLVLGLGLLPRAHASSGGSYEMSRSLPAGSGGVDSDTGNVWLLTGSVQSAGGSVSSSREFSNLSGYLVFHSSYAAIYLTQAVEQIKNRDGWVLGVGTSSVVQLFFETPMLASTLANATTVYLTGDNLGNVFSSTVAFTLSYDAARQAARITPAGGWDWGHSYQVVVGTSAMDADSQTLVSSYTANTLTMMDFSQRNVVRALDGGSTLLDVAPNALSGTGLIVFVSNPLANPDRIDPAQILSANAKALNNLGPQAQALSVSEINAYDNHGALLSENFNVPVMLSLPYSTANGFVVGAVQARPDHLATWVLDEAASLWVKLPNSSVGSAQVTAPLRHFSVYGLLAAQNQDVSQVYPFPVPWRPFSGNPARYGTLSAGITFANVPQSGTIKIYTVSGELVRELQLSGNPTVVWDGKNSAGGDAVSEVYLWAVESGPNRKAGKLMIVR